LESEARPAGPCYARTDETAQLVIEIFRGTRFHASHAENGLFEPVFGGRSECGHLFVSDDHG
jgi:hypothetical protein